MGARAYQELEAWQLADDLRREVIAMSAKAPACEDFRFCNNLRDAAASTCRNIAEGFARRRPRQFAHFMVIALGSLAETSDQLLEAGHRGYLSDAELERLKRLAERVRQTSEGLLRYLQRAANSERQTKP
jgi:four helix bundle protein